MPNLVPTCACEARSNLLDQMEAWHLRAIGYGITSRRSVGRWLGVHLTMAPDFDLSDRVRPLLELADLTGDNKMVLLFGALRNTGA